MKRKIGFASQKQRAEIFIYRDTRFVLRSRAGVGVVCFGARYAQTKMEWQTIFGELDCLYGLSRLPIFFWSRRYWLDRAVWLVFVATTLYGLLGLVIESGRTE